jgi:hypothetical protein
VSKRERIRKRYRNLKKNRRISATKHLKKFEHLSYKERLQRAIDEQTEQGKVASLLTSLRWNVSRYSMFNRQTERRTREKTGRPKCFSPEEIQSLWEWIGGKDKEGLAATKDEFYDKARTIYHQREGKNPSKTTLWRLRCARRFRKN